MASISLPRDLRRYEDDLYDALMDAIDDQEDHAEDAIADLRLDERQLSKAVGAAFELLVNDGMNEDDAIDEAAQMVVDASIYRTLDKRRRLNDIPRDLEDDLKDASEDLDDLVEDAKSSSRRDRKGGGRRDRNERSAERRSDARREASGTATRNRSKRKGDDDEPRRRRGNSAEDRKAEREERKAMRKNGGQPDAADTARDAQVAKAQVNVDLNSEVVVTKQSFAEWVQRKLKCDDVFALGIGPVYYLGNQYVTIKDGQFVSHEDKGTDVFNYDDHRTDRYLRNRSSIRPSPNLRTQAIENAKNARAEYVDELIEKSITAQNAVEGDLTKGTIDQVLILKEQTATIYGMDTSSLDILRHCLSQFKVNGIPQHIVVAKSIVYPTWVMNSDLTGAVENLLKCDRISELPTMLMQVNNYCTDEQWKFFHDRVTSLINNILATVIHTEAYLTSVITEWDSFAGWLERYKNGAFITWFNNNLAAEMKLAFVITKADHANKHEFVDGSDTTFAAIGSMRNIIYMPVSNDNFTVASPTKVGQIHPSLTPDLYWLTSTYFNDKCYENMIVTSSDDYVQLYSRPNAVEHRKIFVAAGF